MASVITGARRHRAALDQPLISSQVNVDDSAVRSAQLACTEFAIAGDWVPELGEVLDALGIRAL